MDKHLILDYEGLSAYSPTMPVVNLATLIFDWDRFRGDEPYTFQELVDDVKFHKFNVKEQIFNAGKVVSQDTLDWWGTLPKSVRKQLSIHTDDIHHSKIPGIFEDLALEVGDFARWWSRGNNFDPVITSTFYEMQGLDMNDDFKYGMMRDVRTYIDGMTDFNLKTSFIPDTCKGVGFEAHNSMHDIVMDVMRLQYVFRLIMI